MNTTPDLHEMTTPISLGEGRFSIEVPDGWQQGRGAFGGLVVAYLVRAVETFAATPDRALRSITSELCGPTMAGPAEIRVEMLRAGNAVSTIAARLIQAGEVQAHAVCVLGRERGTGTDWNERKAPPVKSWREIDPFPMNMPFIPRFAANYIFRVLEPFPFSGGDEARVMGWIRARNPGPVRDAAWTAAHIDAWWPAAFSRLTGPRPMSTVGFTMQIVGDTNGLDPEAPLLHTARAGVSRDGYMVEFRELWGEDGRLLALNQQTFVVVK